VVAGESLDMQGLVDAGTVTTVNGAELTIAESGDLIGVNGTAVASAATSRPPTPPST
jgi:hypothetical protein